MELQIEDLVSSIKKDGIDAANAEAEKIIAEAKKKASEMIQTAKDEQTKIKQQTESEIEVLKESAKVSALQAERDAVLLFKEAIQKQYAKILDVDVQKTVKGETLAALIKAALSEEDPSAYAAEVAEVEEGLKAELADQIQKGLEIRISSAVKTGFRLSAKDGSGYFDCSDDEIAAMLAPFLPEINF